MLFAVLALTMAIAGCGSKENAAPLASTEAVSALSASTEAVPATETPAETVPEESPKADGPDLIV